jgi:hypothetical protein
LGCRCTVVIEPLTQPHLSPAVVRGETCVQRAAFFWLSCGRIVMKIPSVEKAYVGRPEGVATVNFSIDKDALVILQRHAAGPRARGRLLSRLLYEFEAKREAREEMRREVQSLLRTVQTDAITV